MFITVANCSLQRVNAQGRRKMEAWRRHSSLCPFKRGATGRRCLFIIGLTAGKILVWRRIFARISPNFHEKFFVQLLPTNSLPRRSWRPFVVWPPKKVFMWFSAKLGRLFWSQARLGAIFTRIFGDVSQIFSKSKHLGVRLNPTSNKHHCFS